MPHAQISTIIYMVWSPLPNVTNKDSSSQWGLQKEDKGVIHAECWRPMTCIWIPLEVTIYPKKYAHGFCFAVLCCGYTLTDLPISIRLTSLALWQSNDCPSASKATLMNMDKYFMWIHMNDCITTTKQSTTKPCAYFLGYTVYHHRIGEREGMLDRFCKFRLCCNTIRCSSAVHCPYIGIFDCICARNQYFVLEAPSSYATRVGFRRGNEL